MAPLRVASLLLVCLLVMSDSTTAQENWPRFRGVDANSAVADDSRLPDTWSKTTNVKWKTEIPGLGWGSPIDWCAESRAVRFPHLAPSSMAACE